MAKILTVFVFIDVEPLDVCAQVINLQCWPGKEVYTQEACDQGMCCADACVPLDMEHGNGVNTWPLDNTCLDAISKSACSDVVDVQVWMQGVDKCYASSFTPSAVYFLLSVHHTFR